APAEPARRSGGVGHARRRAPTLSRRPRGGHGATGERADGSTPRGPGAPGVWSVVERLLACSPAARLAGPASRNTRYESRGRVGTQAWRPLRGRELAEPPEMATGSDRSRCDRRERSAAAAAHDSTS